MRWVFAFIFLAMGTWSQAEVESLPIAPQTFDGFSGRPQTVFAPVAGEIQARSHLRGMRLPASTRAAKSFPSRRSSVQVKKTTRKGSLQSRRE